MNDGDHVEDGYRKPTSNRVSPEGSPSDSPGDGRIGPFCKVCGLSRYMGPCRCSFTVPIGSLPRLRSKKAGGR